MLLSRIKLDPRRRETMKALASPNLLHGAVEQSFSGPRERRLWRVDTLAGNMYLLLLGRESPDLTALFRQFGPEGEEPVWETKDYTPLLDRISEGSRWHFRLIANPTVSKTERNGTDARGKVYGHITPEYQKKWLLDRADRHGFSLDEEAFRVVRSQWLRFRKGSDGGRPVTLLAVTYEGTLSVTDPELFCQVLVNGLGRGKAYGLGMLTVVNLPVERK